MPLFNQLLADVLDRKLVTVSCKETTGIGAYISMLLGCGEIEEKDISDILIQEKTAVYIPEIEQVTLYTALQKKRRQIEERMPFEAISE